MYVYSHACSDYALQSSNFSITEQRIATRVSVTNDA